MADERCPHVHGVGVGKSGWTREHDPASPYFGRFVDSDPACRKPAFLTPRRSGDED